MNYGKKGVRAKQKALNSKSQKWGRKLALTCVKIMLAAVVGIGICGVAAGIGVFRGILSSTPTIRLSDVVAVGEATIVYDKEGNEIDQYVSTNSNRLSVGMDEIPDYMGKAFVAIEDERFYQHNGIDVKGILRAGYQFIKTGGEEAQGASTITQQLLKIPSLPTGLLRVVIRSKRSSVRSRSSISPWRSPNITARMRSCCAI